MNRLTVAIPKARDTKARPAFIPEAALKKRQQKMQRNLADDEEEMETSLPKRKTEREIELEQGDEYIVDLKKNYDLPEDQKYDVIPETWQGHNIADFIDPDIMEKLEALEKEEEARERAGYYESEESEEDESYAEIKELAGKIRHKKAIMKADQFLDNTTKATLNRKSVAKKRERSVSRLQSEFEDLGVTGLEVDNPDTHFNRARSSSRARPVKKMRLEEGSRSVSAAPRSQSGLRDAKQAPCLISSRRRGTRRALPEWAKLASLTEEYKRRNPNTCSAAREELGKMTEDKQTLSRYNSPYTHCSPLFLQKPV